MAFLAGWLKRKGRKSELEDVGDLAYEEEGLLGGRRSTPSPDQVAGKKSRHGFFKSRTFQVLCAIAASVVVLVYLRMHGSPIALSGLVSMKTPGCYSDYRGKPILKVPVAGQFKGKIHVVDS